MDFPGAIFDQNRFNSDPKSRQNNVHQTKWKDFTLPNSDNIKTNNHEHEKDTRRKMITIRRIPNMKKHTMGTSMKGGGGEVGKYMPRGWGREVVVGGERPQGALKKNSNG